MTLDNYTAVLSGNISPTYETLYIGSKKFLLKKKNCDNVESKSYRREDLWSNRAYNSETKKLTTSPDRQRHFPSDHFPLTMVTIQKDDR